MNSPNNSNSNPNPNANSKNALSEADIDTLSDLLDTLNNTRPCVSLEALDGITAALAVMVRQVSLAELVPVLLDTAESEDDDEDADEVDAATALAGLTAAQQASLAALITRRVNHTERLLSNATIADLSDPRAYQPWTIDYEQLMQTDAEFAAEHKDDEFSPFGAEWAVGFVSAVEHFTQDWRMSDDLLDDELNPMLAPIYAMALPRDEWPEDIRDQDVEGDSREAWLAQSIWACYDLWEYWRYHAPKPKMTPIIKTATLGRNDPCDCGSGKKFKVCHGA
jgi:uncharacterized protein